MKELVHYFNERYEGRIERHAKELIAKADDDGDGVLEMHEVGARARARWGRGGFGGGFGGTPPLS